MIAMRIEGPKCDFRLECDHCLGVSALAWSLHRDGARLPGVLGAVARRLRSEAFARHRWLPVVHPVDGDLFDLCPECRGQIESVPLTRSNP